MRDVCSIAVFGASGAGRGDGTGRGGAPMQNRRGAASAWIPSLTALRPVVESRFVPGAGIPRAANSSAVARTLCAPRARHWAGRSVPPDRRAVVATRLHGVGL